MAFIFPQRLEKLRYSCGRLFRLQPTERGIVALNRTPSRRFRLYRLSYGTKRARLFQQKTVHDLFLTPSLSLSLSRSPYLCMRVPYVLRLFQGRRTLEIQVLGSVAMLMKQDFDHCNEVDCPVDCGWGVWSDWSHCFNLRADNPGTH